MAPTRILVIENQHEITHLLQEQLMEAGVKVEILHAPSGEEGYLLSSFTPLDLVITEYHLPGIDGIELMRRVRRQHPQARVILLSRQSDADTIQAITSAGADACFYRPLPVPELLSSIKNLLSLVEPVPSPVQASPAEESAPPTLADIIANLRQQVKAQALLLIDAEGRVVARAGDLPDMEAEVALLASLLAMHSAGKKVSHLLGQQEFQGWLVFDRGENDLLFLPLGMEHALLALGQEIAYGSQLMEIVKILRDSRETILSRLFEHMETLPILDNQVELNGKKAVNGDIKNGDFDSLLDHYEKSQPGDVDSFWEAATNNNSAPSNADTISYDQARKLGLAPGEDS